MKKLLIVFGFLALSNVSLACGFDGDETNAGTLTPTAGYQTENAVSSGDYFVVSVTCGNTYNFNFCNNGGSASWDTQLTILQTDGVTELADNDDNCGLQSDVSWTADFTGTVYVLVSEFFCDNTGGSNGATLAYNVTPATLDAGFTLASSGCTSATATITGDTGGTFAFNPAPGDAAVIDPTTGAITNGTAGATYTVEYTINCGVSTTQSVTLDATGNPNFTLSVVCGGATANVTGTPGGTFAFNPAPGDGSQIDATTGSVTNGTVGTTYFVEYTVCSSSSIQSATVLDDNCWSLNGDAQYITVGGEQCIQLTAAVNDQTGCAWNSSQIDFASDFTLTLDYYFGNNIGGADGNTFTFQPSGSTACGTPGAQLGAGSISNALAIEFDTYDNDGSATNDLSCDHIAIEIDGDHPDDPSFFPANAAPLCGPQCAKSGGGNIDDGGTYTVDIDWNAATQVLEVYFDGSLRLSCTNDFVTNVFGGQSNVYWGATAATGGLNNQQYFCPSTIVILPVELSSFENTCDGETELFNWTTASEDRVDYFQLEYTYDGLVFYPIEKLNAVGSSQTEESYQVSIMTDDPKQRYYRLKIVDDNGEYDYSDLIAGKRCLYAGELITTIKQTSEKLTLSTKDASEVVLINQLGQVLFSGFTSDKALQIDTRNLATGVYCVNARNQHGIQQTRKVFIKN